MNYYIKTDEKNRTSVHWELEGLKEEMIDWFWCNIEKCNYRKNSNLVFRWSREWGIEQTGTPIDAVYEMEQDGYDGEKIRHLIRIESLDHVPPVLLELICCRHVVVIGGISRYDETEVEKDGPAIVWRMHQWTGSADGVRGITTGYTRPGNDLDSGENWAKQIVKKLQDWELYLADTYQKYKAEKQENRPVFSFCIDRDLNYAG